MAAVVTALVLLAFLLGYRFYGRWVGRRIFEDHEEIVTPAHAQRDDRDFVPTARHILMGHHFTSIAGAAPIIGPCVAVYWGWLPALCWIVVGVVFMGAVHDFGALVMSARQQGRSIADIAGRVITPRVRMMFLCFVLVLTWLVLAVFALAIAGLFVSTPTSVLPINVEILVAVAIGWMIYKKGWDALVPSIVALAILYFFVWYGTDHPVDFVQLGIVDDAAGAKGLWCVLLFVYSGIASLLPVWLLLQPRDFINSHQLLVGLGLLFTGIFVVWPEFDAPAVAVRSEEGAPGVFPLLFVTIACGAISGFHALVASGTSSKQLDKLSDARMVGYGSMLGEGMLALAAVMAAAAGIALVGECTLPGGRVVADLGWTEYYASWASAGSNKAAAFVLGGAAFLQQLGFEAGLAQTLMAVLVISFAATTLDTATRIQRFIITEIGENTGVKPLQNKYLATVLALVPATMLVFASTVDPATGQPQEAAYLLWPIFGASNQMLAALSLLVMALFFWQRRRPVLPLVIPMVIVMVVAFAALIERTSAFLRAENWLLVATNALLLGLLTWMVVESIAVVRQMRHARAQEDR